MPDIAGAMAAIEARLAANWTTTRIAKPNTVPDDPWPPTSETTGNIVPWVLIEIFNTTGDLRAVGEPGNQFWLYTGLIHVHVFAPKGYGIADLRTYATQIGEIFRNKVFYNDTPGYQVRTNSPFVDGGDVASDDIGTWFRVTMTCGFEYYHRG